MGLFEKIFGAKGASNAQITEYFKTFTAYNPRFVSHNGALYEMDVTRAAIHAIATHCSKLKPNVVGSGNKRLERILQVRPNPWMTSSQFLYRVATILEADNTAFILPMLDRDNRIVGFYPVCPVGATVVEHNGIQYLRFEFGNGQKGAMQWDKVGVLTKMQYKSDIFGASNEAIRPTMDLISIQNQGIQEGIKNAATIRFMAKLGNSLRHDDLLEEQKRFRELNLTATNNNGVMIFDQKYQEVKQIEAKPYTVDADQMKIINDNVFNYFGVNEKILRNEWDEQTWNAFYEGKVEPFALQMSLVLTSMCFTDKEIAFGNEIQLSSNRLQYASVSSKMSVITQLFDRGLISFNEGREILQLPPVENGDEFMIRGEYVNRADKDKDEPVQDPEPEPIAEPEPDPEPEDKPDDEDEMPPEFRSHLDAIEKRSKEANEMPFKPDDREYRNVQEFRADDEGSYIVEGYASTFEPYVMFTVDDRDYSERIDPHAFDKADMSDVIFQYNHDGQVMARQKNGTLELSVDNHGLKIRADLSHTPKAKEMYEEIRSGMIDQMSFAFVVDSDHYEKETRTRVVDSIRKVYDVSPVSIPANPGTQISARSFFDGVIEEEKQELLEAERREQKIKLLKLTLMLGETHEN